MVEWIIQVDLRDHEKLCGESIECKCGLKFAFKCNLVAHKKAHPVCQEQSSKNHHNSSANSNNSSCNQSTITSDEDSSQYSGGRSNSQRRGTKRLRTTYEESAISSSIASQLMSTNATPAPSFGILPDKTARYDPAGDLQRCTNGSAVSGMMARNLPGVGLASPVYASRILSMSRATEWKGIGNWLDNYSFSPNCSQLQPRRLSSPVLSSLELTQFSALQGTHCLN